jgi:hypothetical protein
VQNRGSCAPAIATIKAKYSASNSSAALGHLGRLHRTATFCPNTFAELFLRGCHYFAPRFLEDPPMIRTPSLPVKRRPNPTLHWLAYAIWKTSPLKYKGGSHVLAEFYAQLERLSQRKPAFVHRHRPTRTGTARHAPTPPDTHRHRPTRTGRLNAHATPADTSWYVPPTLPVSHRCCVVPHWSRRGCQAWTTTANGREPANGRATGTPHTFP